MVDSEKRILEAMAAATVSRGKLRGRMLAKCPAMGTDAGIFWQAAQLCHGNRFKVSIGRLVFLSDSEREFWRECMDWLEARPRGIILDRDREALERMGVWR